MLALPPKVGASFLADPANQLLNAYFVDLLRHIRIAQHFK
jgi:hypothetical protein